MPPKINRTRKLRLNLLLWIASCFCLHSAIAERPNVIIILVDDLGYRDLGFTGATEFKTPNIDRLAHEGVIFKNGYASHSFCGPTRAGLVTGRYQQRFGFETNPAYAPRDAKSGLPKTETTIATRLKDVGYRTGVVGKWHLGHHPDFHPLNRGFDYFFGMLGGGHDFWETDSTRLNESYLHPLVYNKEFANVEGYLTHQLTDKAIEFIEESKDEPFFLYLSYNAPHAPFHAPQETVDSLSHIEHKFRRAYAAMVVEVDRDVGRVMDTLEELGLTKDTLIFFLSDNGGPQAGTVTDNLPFRDGKGAVYEGGIHVPFFAYWPGTIKGGQEFDYPVISIDLAPTAAALAGADQGNMEGVNLIPYVTGEETGAPHDYIFFRRRDGAAWAIIDKDGHKLARTHWESDKKEYYNLNNDPSETTDLNNPEHAATVDRLQAKWDDWNKDNIRYQFWDFPDHYKQQDQLYQSQRQ